MLDTNDSEDKAGLYSRVFPEGTYSPTAFRLLMSYLQKLVDQFLALEQWQNTPAAVESDLVQAYRQKGLDRHFQDALQLAKLTLERQPLRNSEYYLRSGALLWEKARYNSQPLPEYEQYLIGLSDHADLIWLTQKLRYLCLHTGYRTRFNSTRDLSLRREVETILESYDFLENTAISTWYDCLKMLEVPDAADYFSRLKQGVLTHGLSFDQDELRDLHLFAINYCIRRVNEGQTGFFHDIMDFYKDGLAKGLLLENGILSHFTYYNIVAAGLQTREYEWVEAFIPGYRNTLERSYRDSAYSFNLARLKFARKAYDEALELLQHSNYHEPLLHMAAKTMALKIYYALEEYDVLSAHLEAFIKYIRRKPGLGYHRNNYLQLARYTQKLIGLNWNDKSEVQALRQKIAAEPVLTEREWLLEQF
ncbi:MAG: hypothetical protein IPJ82_02865 [Lewinellaceae bacterium]|nr:hypothetical protein [Lewinellaceae bacterium]